MTPSGLIEGLEMLKNALEKGAFVEAGEIASKLEGLPMDQSELPRARELHQQCEAMSQERFDLLKESIESTGKARSATRAYQDSR